MTVTDQIKILDRKIMQNEAQYDLDRKAAKISALSSNNLDKYEYLTGEDLGLKPSTIEQTKFEYSLLGKIFNRELDQDDTREDSFKRLRNIEGKIKSKNKKESEPIKNEEQSEVLKDQLTTTDKKKPKEIVLLKDKLDYILENFGSNFNSTGKNFLKKLAKDEKEIDYNDLFFEVDDPIIKSFDFLSEVGTLYDFLINLLNENQTLLNSSGMQVHLAKIIESLNNIIF